MTGAQIPRPCSRLEALWLAHAELGAEHGAAIEMTIPPGEGYETHRLAASKRVLYLYRGEGVHLGSGGPLELEADDVLVFGPGAWHGFENRGDSDAVVWLAWAPGSSLEEAGYEALAEGMAANGSAPLKRKLREVEEDPETTPEERGFHNLGVIWDGAEDADAITLGWGHVEPDAVHEMHPHQLADEVLYVDEGVGVHATPGSERELTGPDHEFFPAGEWHSMEVRTGRLEGTFFDFGASDLDGTGYQLESEVLDSREQPG